VEACVLQGSHELQPRQSIHQDGQNSPTRSFSSNSEIGFQSDGSHIGELEQLSEAGGSSIDGDVQPIDAKKRYKTSSGAGSMVSDGLRATNQSTRGRGGWKRGKRSVRLSTALDPTKPISIDELIYKYPCCPPEAFFNIPEFYANTNLNTFDLKDHRVTIPLRNWAATLRRWSIADFNKYYNDEQVHPYFNAYGSHVSNMYYSVSESVRIAKQLLMHQFSDDVEAIIDFMQTLYDILDKRVPKLNSMCVKSPPSAGKNFFFDAVTSYFISYGMFGTANKNNNFSWADGAGKRVILWNEPNYEQNQIEKIKELLGGDTTRIHVKYMNDISVQRVPIIILTNNHISVISHPAFKDRLRVYTWQSAAFLRDYDRKLNPLMFYELLLEYDIINK